MTHHPHTLSLYRKCNINWKTSERKSNKFSFVYSKKIIFINRTSSTHIYAWFMENVLLLIYYFLHTFRLKAIMFINFVIMFWNSDFVYCWIFMNITWLYNIFMTLRFFLFDMKLNKISCIIVVEVVTISLCNLGIGV